VRWLSDEEYEIIEQQSTSDAAVKAITMTVAKMDGVQDAPAVLEGKPPAKVKAKVEESEEGSDVEEPVVRKEVAKKPVVESKPSLAAMVSDWDDE
jgi:FtsZ-interacting cell division protein ZipA